MQLEYSQIVDMVGSARDLFDQIVRGDDLEDINEWERYKFEEPAADSVIKVLSRESLDSFDLHRLYAASFHHTWHSTWYTSDNSSARCVLSVRKAANNILDILVRTQFGIQATTRTSRDDTSELEELHMIVSRAIGSKKFTLLPSVSLDTPRLILDYDRKFYSDCFKFGVIYQKPGQVEENEIFGNNDESEQMKRFLRIIGERVHLKNFKGYLGGLNDKSSYGGQQSVYRKYKDYEIMFHVATMLPHSEVDRQQIERKRHIGNDIFAIVFQDEATEFSPTWISSKFLSGFIVVSAIGGEKTGYKVSVITRQGVPSFPPEIPDPPYFQCDETFGEWLIQKLICGQVATCNSPYFRKLLQNTRDAELTALTAELNKRNAFYAESMHSSLLCCGTDRKSGVRLSTRRLYEPRFRILKRRPSNAKHLKDCRNLVALSKHVQWPNGIKLPEKPR